MAVGAHCVRGVDLDAYYADLPEPLSAAEDAAIVNAGVASAIAVALFLFLMQVALTLRLFAPSTSDAVCPCIRVSPPFADSTVVLPVALMRNPPATAPSAPQTAQANAAIDHNPNNSKSAPSGVHQQQLQQHGGSASSAEVRCAEPVPLSIRKPSSPAPSMPNITSSPMPQEPAALAKEQSLVFPSPRRLYLYSFALLLLDATAALLVVGVMGRWYIRNNGVAATAWQSALH